MHLVVGSAVSVESKGLMGQHGRSQCELVGELHFESGFEFATVMRSGDDINGGKRVKVLFLLTWVASMQPVRSQGAKNACFELVFL